MHPIFGNNFTGCGLVRLALSDFFTPGYAPKSYYRSPLYFLSGSTQLDHQKVEQMVQQGFDELQAIRSLSICQNDI